MKWACPITTFTSSGLSMGTTSQDNVVSVTSSWWHGPSCLTYGRAHRASAGGLEAGISTRRVLRDTPLRARPGPVSLQYQVPQSGRLVSYDCHMSTPILGTKLYALPLRPNAVPRPSLIERLDEGLQSRLILVSAPAGFGKTTIVSEWVAGCSRLEPEVRPAWLSLDEGDSDSALFLAYLVAALRTVAAGVGQGVMSSRSPAKWCDTTKRSPSPSKIRRYSASLSLIRFGFAPTPS